MLQAILASGLIKVIKLIAVGIGIIIVFRYFKNRNNEKKYVKDDKDAADNPAKGQAISLRAAMNPSGSASLFDVDGTNKTAIMNIATEIKDLQAVIDAYNERFSGSLLHHLEIEIGAEELQRFIALAGGAAKVANTNYESIKTGVATYNLVRTIKPTNARSTPVKPGYFDHGNILKLFDANNVIGQSTGKTQYDAKNDIIFIEVKVANKRKQLVTFWVAKSQVELISPEDYTKRKASGEKFTLQQFDGLGAVPTPELATRRATVIYDENFEPTDKVRDRARLGPPTMFLRFGNKLLVRFRTVDGARCWVDTKDVFLFLPTSF
jgi:hypothetical protein